MEPQNPTADALNQPEPKASLLARLKKRKKLVVVLFLIILAWLGLYVVTLFVKRSSDITESHINPHPSSTPGASIFPSEFPENLNRPDTRSEIEQEYGSPIETGSYTGKQYYFYNSIIPPERNEAVYDGNEVIFFKRVLQTNEISINHIFSQYGNEPVMLYGPGMNAGIHLFVYFNQGFAFYATEDKKYIFELWYFPPTISTQDFIVNWAPEFSLEREGVGAE